MSLTAINAARAQIAEQQKSCDILQTSLNTTKNENALFLSNVEAFTLEPEPLESGVRGQLEGTSQKTTALASTPGDHEDTQVLLNQQKDGSVHPAILSQSSKLQSLDLDSATNESCIDSIGTNLPIIKDYIDKRMFGVDHVPGRGEIRRSQALSVLRKCDFCSALSRRDDGALLNGRWPCWKCFRDYLRLDPKKRESTTGEYTLPFSATSTATTGGTVSGTTLTPVCGVLSWRDNISLESSSNESADELNPTRLQQLWRYHCEPFEEFAESLTDLYYALEVYKIFMEYNKPNSGSNFYIPSTELCDIPVIPSKLEQWETEANSVKVLLEKTRVKCITTLKIDPDTGSSTSGAKLSQLIPATTSDSEDSSDEDETWWNMRNLLAAFQKGTEQWILLPPILHQRRRKDLRAWARLLRYSSVTLHDKSMLVHKAKAKLPRQTRKAADLNIFEQLFPNLQDTDWLNMDQPYSSTNVQPPRIWSMRDTNHGYGSAGSDQFSAGSFDSYTTGSKKRRMEKSIGAFVCSHAGCSEVFDRQCDLSHHERCHLPYEERPHPCEQCSQRFLWPKDLRRHERVHEKRSNST